MLLQEEEEDTVLDECRRLSLNDDDDGEDSDMARVAW